MCQVSIFFYLVRFQRWRSKVFPTWLPYHVTSDVISVIKTFHMSIRTNGGNLLSIRQAVAEKNTKVLCGQTNRQTDRQMDPNAILSTSARENNALYNRFWPYLSMVKNHFEYLMILIS